MKVVYEWDIETHDPVTGELLSHNYATSLSEYGTPKGALTENASLCLIRNELDDGSSPLESLVNNKYWAYLDRISLNEFFQDVLGEDGERVPVRFHTELSKWLKS